MVRWSTRNSKGTGGQMVQIKRIETMQTTTAIRSKQLTNLNAATQGKDINPMCHGSTGSPLALLGILRGA